MTLQELYDKVMASDALKKSFAEAAQDKGKLEAWLKEQGCDATAEQVAELLKGKQASGEVSDDELENVAGGSGWKRGSFNDTYMIPDYDIPIFPWLCSNGTNSENALR